MHLNVLTLGSAKVLMSPSCDSSLHWGQLHLKVNSFCKMVFKGKLSTLQEQCKYQTTASLAGNLSQNAPAVQALFVR